MATTTSTKLAIGAAAFAAAMAYEMPLAAAFGDAPWCAVISVGTGSTYWDCEYRTVEECVPNVLAGNRGTCGLNPDPAPRVAARAVYSRHQKHLARHD